MKEVAVKNLYAAVTLKAEQGYRTSSQVYFRTYLTDFVSSLAGLTLSLVSGVGLVMSSYHTFAHN